MAKLVQKWRKAVSGCVNKNNYVGSNNAEDSINNKDSLIENDFLQPTLNATYEFKFNKESSKTNNNNSNGQNQTNSNNVYSYTGDCTSKHPIYVDYDNLERKQPKNSSKNQNETVLKESNIYHNSNSLLSKGLKRVLNSSKSSEKYTSIKQVDENNNFIYAELYDYNAEVETTHKKLSKDEKENKENNLFNSELDYCEIPEDCDFFGEDEPLINLKETEKSSSQKKSSTKPIEMLMKKSNSFGKNENVIDLAVKSMKQQQLEQTQKDNETKTESSKCLTDIRELGTFLNQSEAFQWYLNLVFETMSKCINADKTLGDLDKTKRINISTAHLLYARNFYEMRIANSAYMRGKLTNTHPCLIALACLLDSDQVCITESHSCACDSYVYMFATRLKFCAWKSKLFIILKRPKRSSIDRLTLIEDLTKCHKMIQEKPNE